MDAGNKVDIIHPALKDAPERGICWLQTYREDGYGITDLRMSGF